MTNNKNIGRIGMKIRKIATKEEEDIMSNVKLELKYSGIDTKELLKYKEKEISFDIPLLVKASLSLSKLESKLIYQIDQLIR